MDRPSSQLAQAQISLLNDLGITPWIERERTETSTSQLMTLNQVDAAKAAVLLRAPAPELHVDHPLGGLLLNILAALKQPLSSFAVYAQEQAGPVHAGLIGRCQRMSGSDLVLIFAGDALQSTSNNHNLIALPGLSDMLEDPMQKRLAWRSLKPLIERLGANGS